MPQGPLLTVHTKLCAPTGNADIVALGLLAEEIVPEPSAVHVPVAGAAGVFADITADAGPPLAQNSWSDPALAVVVVLLKIFTMMSSKKLPQSPLVTVHLYVLMPTGIFVIVAVGLLVLENEPPPVRVVHTPVAGNNAGVAASVVLLVGVQKF